MLKSVDMPSHPEGGDVYAVRVRKRPNFDTLYTAVEFYYSSFFGRPSVPSTKGAQRYHWHGLYRRQNAMIPQMHALYTTGYDFNKVA